MKFTKSVSIDRPLLFADYQLIIQQTENKLQTSVYQLYFERRLYNMKISVSKTEVMAFRGAQSARSKIIIHSRASEQTSHFRYLGSD